MFQMVGVFSEFERSMISERVKLGLQRVKLDGKSLGRPKKINDVVKKEIINLVNNGWSLSKVANHLNLSRMSIHRILSQHKFESILSV